MERWLIKISGRVQGVFYRKSVLEFVQTYIPNLKGRITNLSDGRVEILGIGDVKDLEKLLAFCQEGPPLAEVIGVDVDKLESVEEEFEDFSIV